MTRHAPRRLSALTGAFVLTAGLVAGVAPGAVGGVAAGPASKVASDTYGTVRNILPPGSNGNVTAADLLALGGSTTATGTSPEHYADQLETYDALTRTAPAGLTRARLNTLFKDAGFVPNEVVSTETPRSDVTIRRDEFGVPYISGTTFEGVEFGAGYAAVEDRMFLMDVLRHTGAARLAEFVGNTPSNIAMDQGQLRSAYYTPAEATAQIQKAATRAGSGGPRLLAAVDNFLEGINAAQDDLCPLLAAPTCPVEYAALQKMPADWTRADVVYVASLVGGIFGKGGGNETANAAWFQRLAKKFGQVEAKQVYDDLREKDDPEAPVTATVRTPYELGSLEPGLVGVALPDLDGRTASGTGDPTTRSAPVAARPVGGPGRPAPAPRIDLPNGRQLEFSLRKQGMSNAILVTAKESTTGHPLAVMGPQTGYFTPQLLVEQVLDGPGIKARGVAFAGTNLFVQLGHGVDYAWSATSAGSDNVDTVAERLCNVDGSKATINSLAYLVGSTCTPMERFTHTETTTPNAAAPAPSQTYEFQVLRTRHGIVQSRTTVKGKPIALVSQRSTYKHEVDSVIGFGQFNDPGYVTSAETYQQAASHIDFTFNWFYADSRDIGYYSSGLVPYRSGQTDSDLPRWGDTAYDWKGFLRPDKHVKQINPARGYFVSWNNKPAPGFAAADDNWSYGPIYRSKALEDRLVKAIQGTKKVDLTGMVRVMSDAATVDSRAAYTLPLILRVIGKDPKTTKARELLSAWAKAGAPRVDRDRKGGYSHQAAIAIFDDLWRHPGSGSVAYDVLRGRLGRPLAKSLPQKLDDHPRQGIGSAWNGVAWYGYVNKDLRQVLGDEVDGAYHATYCGGGKLARCRSTLRAALRASVARQLRAQGVGAVGSLKYDKAQDQIRSVTAGLVGVRPIDWQNRPTFQQIVSYLRHR